MTMTGLFGRVRNTRPVVVKRLGLIAGGVLIGTFQLCGWVRLRINTSPSLPVGLYITSSEPEANLVEFCPAEPFASLAISRGYRDRGACHDGATPLLKPIVAQAGDVVEISRQGIAVNGRHLPNTAPRTADTHGRPLPHWPPGRYVVAPNTVWVASSYEARSFDSRYFGPIPTHSIRDHVRPLLTTW
jgi:conjugative transfer signal peptidase TraF